MLKRILLLATLVAPACVRVSPPRPTGRLGAFESDVARLLPSVMDSMHVPGVAVAVVQNGAVEWSSGYGFADTAKRLPVTPRTVFQVASISKSVAAWGVMKLVERKRIALDVPVERYLTRWHFPPTDSAIYRDQVTIRRLLSHTAGLSLGGYPGFDPDSGPLPSIEASLSGATGGVGDVHIAFRPGTRWQYSGGGYTVLQLLVEERSGRPFADYMQDEVLDPLGMTSSSYRWLPSLRPRTATGYDRRGRPLPNYVFTELAAAGLYTDAEDLARFVAAGTTGPNGQPPGRGVLAPASVAQLYTPQPHSESPLGVGYGFGEIIDTLSNGAKLVSHTGGNRGWRSLFILLPDRRQGLVVLTNGDRGDVVYNRVACHWLAIVVGATRRGC